MKLSCFFIASASAQVDLFADDMLKSDFYGPISDEYQVKVQKPNDVECCSTLKLWGDIGLFAGRFDLSSKTHNGKPVFKAAGGDMKIFYNDYLNRWTVSDEVNDRVLLRGLGSATECPTDSDWLIWNGQSFEAPDLTEPWAPYVKSEQMLECRPLDFSIEKLKQQIGDSLCRFIQSEGSKNTRFCREGEKIAEMIFADWESTTNQFLNENLSMILEKISTLDQWHSVVNSILIKRTFETQDDVVEQIKEYIRIIIADIKANFIESKFAEDDSRFLYLKV